MLSIILLFLTACTGDQTDELNKYLSLEWGLIASLTALITPIILIVFMYLLFKIKHLFYDFFIRTPYKTTVNAYVGGDAYNYIINSNHMIAYFILALVCVIIACTFIIVNAISGQKSQGNK